MEHNFRKPTARLNVLALEERTQPGSLLLSGIEVGAIAEVIAQPEQPASVKRIKKTEDIQITNGLADVQHQIVNSRTNLARPASKDQAIQPSVNPALHQPAAERAFTTRQHVKRAEMQASPVRATSLRADFGSYTMQGKPSGGSVSIVNDGTAGDDRMPPIYVQFYMPGTDFQDGVNEITAIPGSTDTIACGFQGQRGTLRRVSKTGVNTHSTNFAVTPASAERLAVTGCTTNAAGTRIYATLTKTGPGGLIENRVVAGPTSLGAEAGFTQIVYPFTAAPTVVALNDVGVDVGTGHITVTGSADVGLGYSTLVDFTYTDTAGFAVLDDTVTWDYGVEAVGLTTAGNGSGRFHSGYLDDGLQQSPLWNRFESPGGSPTQIWGWIATVDGAHTTSDLNAIHSVAVNPAGDELFLSGGLDAPTLAPPEGTDPAPYQGNLVAQDSQATGGFAGPYAFWYFVNGGIGSGIAGDYYARGNTFSPDGGGGFNHVTVGSIDDLADTSVAGTQSRSFGDISEFDSAGGLPSFRSVGDENAASTDGPEINRDTDGMGVAFDGFTISPGPGRYYVYGGSTSAGEAGSTNPFGGPFSTFGVTGPDSGYGAGTGPGGQDQGTTSGVRDGYVGRECTPFG